jgi:hypothetical protein
MDGTTADVGALAETVVFLRYSNVLEEKSTGSSA